METEDLEIELKAGERKPRELVLCGLYWRDVELWQLPAFSMANVQKRLELGWVKMQSNDKHSNRYQTSPTTLEMRPTYSMHEKNFEAFVCGLEKVIKKMRNGLNALDKLKRPLKRDDIERTTPQYLKSFFDKYEEVFKVLVYTGTVYGMRYFNLDFFPRSGKGNQLKLFRRFINAWGGMDFDRLPIKKEPDLTRARNIKRDYSKLLPRAKKIIEDYKKQRERSSSLDAAVKTIKKINPGLPRGSWKMIAPYLKGNRRHSAGKLTLKILTLAYGGEPRSLERYIYTLQ